MAELFAKAIFFGIIVFMVENEPEKLEEGSAGSVFGADFWEITKIIIISLLIVLPIRYYIVQPFIVRGASMEPNFADNDYLVIDEITYRFRDPERGEVIVFRYPRDPRQFFIKRIVGLPGERIMIKEGRVKIINPDHPDGFYLEEPYIDTELSTRPEGSITLRDDEYYVLGDNRDSSSDSRVWGALNKRFIVGRALFRAWPIKRAGVLVPQQSFNY